MTLIRPHQSLPFEPDPTRHCLEQFHEAVSDYFILLGKPAYETMYYRRLGPNKETLDEIAADFYLTRERVRQITAICHNDILKLLRGTRVKKPHCSINKTLLQYLSSYIEQFWSWDFLLKDDLISDARILPEDRQYYTLHLDIIMEGLGHTSKVYRGKEYYTRGPCAIDISSFYDNVYGYLIEKASPVSLSEISNATDYPEHFTKLIIRFSTDILEVSPGYYHLANEALDTYADMGYRVLKEHGKPMHFKDLYEKMGVSCVATGVRFQKDPRLINLGKTGMWGLAEWHINHDTIIDLIVKALQYTGKPMTSKQLVLFVRSARPEIKAHTIRSYVKIYRHRFSLTPEREVALKEWNIKEKISVESTIRIRRSRLDMRKFKLAILETIKDETLTARELAERLHHLYPEESLPFLTLRLYSMKVLTKAGDRGGVLLLKKNPDFKKHIDPMKDKRLKSMNMVADYLGEKGPSFISDVLRYLQPLGFVKASSYRFLKEDPRFMICKSDKGLNKIISLNKN